MGLLRDFLMSIEAPYHHLPDCAVSGRVLTVCTEAGGLFFVAEPLFGYCVSTTYHIGTKNSYVM